MKILCTIVGCAEEAKEILSGMGSLTCGEPTKEALADTEILVIQLGFTVDKAVIDSAPNLKIIATATTGLDHIDVAHAESKGIKVLSLTGETKFLETITPTAELALGLMLALIRKIPSAYNSVIANKWDRAAFQGHSLYGKVLGIIGYGRLGKMMGKYGEALGMKVVFTDPDMAGGVSQEELLKTSDVVSLHVNLTKETEGIIDGEALSLMKPAAYLINTSRGQIVDEEAIIEALEGGRLAGYATDVLADELEFTADKASSLMIEYAKTHDNVIITPHIGGTTVEARRDTDVFIANKIKDNL